MFADTIGYARSFARFPFALRRFLAEPASVGRARAALEARLAQRSQRFLDLVEAAVYQAPRSPYRALLELADCPAACLAERVEAAGVEGALRTLRERGVYLTFEELKGRRPLVRRGRTLATAPRDFDNPAAHRHLTLATSGSTGLANAVYQDLEHVAELADDELLALDAHGVAAAPTVVWSHILPGSGIRYLLQRARHGRRDLTWYTPIGWRDSGHWLKYGAATRYMLLWMRALGVPVEPPAVVRPEQAAVVAAAVRTALDRGGRCLLRCNVSQAVRVASAAIAARLDLDGAVARLISEPLTPAKRRRIEESGLRVMAGYGSVETGAIGLGCRNAVEPDEVHLLSDSFAVVDHPHPLPDGAVVPALLLTGLRMSAPKVLLNYQIDDCGELHPERRCGCPLEALGWTRHLHSIRSYGKWVGEGVTLIGNELLAVLEEELPARFGGGPLDYQLVEREDEQGLTRVVLVVSPRVAITDENRVVPYLIERLCASSPMGDAAGTVWRGAGTVQLERSEPAVSGRGKLQPFVPRTAAR